MLSPYLYPGLDTEAPVPPLQRELWRMHFTRVWGAVCRACGLDTAVRTTNPGRQLEVVMARYLAMHLATPQRPPGMETAYYRELGAFFGRHRTTVYHALRVVDTELATYGTRWKYYDALQRARAELHRPEVRAGVPELTAK